MEHVQRQIIDGTQGLEATDREAQRAFQARLTETGVRSSQASAWLLNASMVSSLQQAEEIQ